MVIVHPVTEWVYYNFCSIFCSSVNVKLLFGSLNVTGAKNNILKQQKKKKIFKRQKFNFLFLQNTSYSLT